MGFNFQDLYLGAQYDATRATLTKTERGWEVRIGGELVGVAETRDAAKRLVGAL